MWDAEDYCLRTYWVSLPVDVVLCTPCSVCTRDSRWLTQLEKHVYIKICVKLCRSTTKALETLLQGFERTFFKSKAGLYVARRASQDRLSIRSRWEFNMTNHQQNATEYGKRNLWTSSLPWRLSQNNSLALTHCWIELWSLSWESQKKLQHASRCCSVYPLVLDTRSEAVVSWVSWDDWTTVHTLRSRLV